VAIVAVCSCSGPPPQAEDEASITYRVKFTAGPADNTRVIFPLPEGAARTAIMMGIMPDAGTVAWVDQGDAGPGAHGLGAALDARGSAEASYFIKALKGVGGGTGAPDVTLSMQVPDGGPGDLYLRVNKSGSAIVAVEYEFTASRDCGPGCGGKKSWTYSGSVGTALQPVQMTYVEEKR